MDGRSALRARRGAALAASVAIPATLVFGLGHRGVHMARNELAPGAGLIDEHLLAGLAFMAMGILATVLWLRWGADWTVLAVVAGAMATSAALTGDPHAPVASIRAAVGLQPIAAAHEFPLVVLVVAALSWMRSIAGRLPLVGRLLARRHRHRTGLADLGALAPVDRCRAVSVLVLAGADDPAARATAAAADVARRARRVGVVARWRCGGDPFRRDHAHARTALSLTGALAAAESDAFVRDAGRNLLGVPCSEPGWVRPLDGTLSALALARAGHPAAADAWAAALGGELGLRRGHRPAWWWTPLGVGAGAAPAWEHAAATALARAGGLLVDDRDWHALRARALGAAARGGELPDDERLIAAARVWLALVDDPEVARIVARPGVRRDPLACALDRLATAVATDGALIRRAVAGPPHGDPTARPDAQIVSPVPCAAGAVEGSRPA